MVTVKLKNVAGDHVVRALNNALQTDIGVLGVKRAHDLSTLADVVDEKRAGLRKVIQKIPNFDSADSKTKEEFDDLLESPVEVKQLPHGILDGLDKVTGVDYHALKPLIAEAPALSVVK